MIVYSLAGTTVVFALYCLYILWRSAAKQWSRSWHSLLFCLALGAFVYLYGTWVFLSVYLKYIFGGAFLAIVLLGRIRRKNETNKENGRGRRTINLFLTLVFAVLSILYFTGTTGKPETVAMQFPLKAGNYFVLQGGKGLPTNFRHITLRGTIYAMDIVKLNKSGNRAKKIFSKRLEDYGIFNDTIYSPCNGRVISTRDHNPDNIPPTTTSGYQKINAVTIETESFYVFMGHLKQYSVLVNEGDEVGVGQPLALVGNSGFSIEPHLHIQAHKKTNGKPWYQEEPLYIEFDGRSYLMFEVIRPHKVDMIMK